MADGYILIDTEIDQSGLEDGLKTLKAKAQDGVKIVASALAAVATAAAAAGIAAIKTGIDFESAFAGVKKTVNATDEQLAQLRDGILGMSEDMPQTAAQISSVAEAAGQLGIKTENVLDFTRVMADLGVATNMSAEEAATSLARLANITQMPQSEFSRLGSTVVALGNNLATTEAEITAMSLRVAAAGKQVGMTEAQIMGFSGALSSVGIEAEAGGTAFSKLVSDIQLATVKGGKDLQNFADVAGMSASEFAQSFKDDATTAIIAFITGLSKVGDQGKSAIQVLDEMGITEIRMRDALLRAAGASGVFTQALDIGTTAWEENAALTKEAEQRYATLESRLLILKNSLSNLGIAIYDNIRDPLADATGEATESINELTNSIRSGGLTKSLNTLGTSLGNFVKQLGEAANKHIPKFIDAGSWLIDNAEDMAKILGVALSAVAAFKITQTIVPMITALSAAYGTATLQLSLYAAANGTAAIASAALNGTLTVSEILVAALTGKITLATAAQALWTAAIAANPIGLLAIGIAAATAALVGFAIFTEEAESALSGLNDQIDEVAQSANDLAAAHKSTADAAKSSKDEIDGETSAAAGLSKRLSDLAKNTNKTAAEKAEMAAIVEQLNGLVPDLALAYDQEKDSLNQSIAAIDNYIAKKKEEALLTAYMEDYVRLQKERLEIEKQLQAATDAKAQADATYADIQAKYNVVAQDTSDALNVWSTQLGEAKTAVDNAAAAETLLNDQMTANTQATAENDTAIQAVSDSIGNMTAATDEAAAAAERVVIGNYDMTEALSAAGISAEEAAEKYQTYADKTQDAFGRIREDTALTVSEMTKNLEENQRTVDEWSTNLGILAERGIEAGLLQKLREAGPEAAGTVGELVKASDTELAKLDDVFRNGSEVATQALLEELGLPEVVNSGSKMVDDIASGVEQNTALEDEAKQLIKDTKTATTEAIKINDFSSVGYSISEGLASGVRSGSSLVASAVADIIRDALASGQIVAETGSPSKLFDRELGKPMAQGVAQGYVNEAARLMRDMEDTVQMQQQRMSEQLMAQSAPPSYGATAEDLKAGDTNINIELHVDSINNELDVEEVSRQIATDAELQMRYKGVLRK